ncbi:MAG: PQQ-dependent sugar dehydrogenase, partial [Bacteroidetes bacterium]|nr:PQQ-dependent sugar dehydrogenase [Bacteroidota bacterium]
MKSRYYALSLLFASLFSVQVIAQPKVEFQQWVTGFNRPVDIINAGDSRLFIVEQDGIIKIIDSTGTTNTTPFININARVGSGGNEQGLLGLAFHPNYSTNGYFYVNYTDNSGDTKISRFSVSTDPDIADDTTEMVILTISQPFSNHNGGGVRFGADGYLYIGTGDGGSGGDPGNRAQDPQNLLGKMLRIDVDGASPYAIPTTNPFVDSTAVLDEIWAIGLRNPWRFSFDRQTGDLWIGDVGQNAWEEVDFEPASSPGGINWGWRCYEGDVTYNNSGCAGMANYEFPAVVYRNSFSTGCTVVGGYVYRGSKYSDLEGHYIYGDYCSGYFYTLYPNGQGGFDTTNQR